MDPALRGGKTGWVGLGLSIIRFRVNGCRFKKTLEILDKKYQDPNQPI